MKRLGSIHRLQIQRGPLKQGERPHRWYDPAPLLSVPRLWLSFRGAVAEHDGEALVDVHHLDHPRSRYGPEDANSLTLGFLGHYAAMQARFGERITEGVAGETIIVDGPALRLKDLGESLLVRGADGRELRLHQISVARPCMEFSHFVLGHTMTPGEPHRAAHAQLKETLQFLDEGTRGFRMTLQSPEAAWIEVGDEVFSI